MHSKFDVIPLNGCGVMEPQYLHAQTMSDDLYRPCTFEWGAKQSALITPHWKELQSCNLHHSVPLEMPFHMVSFLAKVKFFRFWPKTMDYNKAFLPKSR